MASITQDNLVLVEGHFIGRIEGFSFINDVSKNPHDKKEVLKVVRRTLAKELKNRVELLQTCDDNEISFDEQMNMYWKNHLLAKLVKGSSVIKPRIFIRNFTLLDDIDKKKLRKIIIVFEKDNKQYYESSYSIKCKI